MSDQPQRDRAAWLRGGAVECAVKPPSVDRPWRLVLLGAPGVGKGTQAELLSQRLGACHLSTGDVFRAAKCLDAAARSPAMSAALDYMRRGDLVPDTSVLDMVRERAGCLQCQGGFLLDGFPRTVAQAEALQELLAATGQTLDAVISYELPIDEVVARLSGRLTCGQCKAVFHGVSRPPARAGVCDHCGGALMQREDDRPESVRIRLEAYERSTAPLTAFYRERDCLVTVAAVGSPEVVLAQTLAALGVSAGVAAGK